MRQAARTAYLSAEGLAHGVSVSAAAQADRDTAAGVFNFLDSRRNYVQSLQLLPPNNVLCRHGLPGADQSVDD